MCTVCLSEALQYREKRIQISKKARASIDEFGPSSVSNCTTYKLLASTIKFSNILHIYFNSLTTSGMFLLTSKWLD